MIFIKENLFSLIILVIVDRLGIQHLEHGMVYKYLGTQAGGGVQQERIEEKLMK